MNAEIADDIYHYCLEGPSVDSMIVRIGEMALANGVVFQRTGNSFWLNGVSLIDLERMDVARNLKAIASTAPPNVAEIILSGLRQ